MKRWRRLVIVCTLASEYFFLTRSDGLGAEDDDEESSCDAMHQQSPAKNTCHHRTFDSPQRRQVTYDPHNRIPGHLRPADLPGPVAFDNFERNSTVTLLLSSNGRTLNVAEGTVTQINTVDRGSMSANFSLLTQALPRETVDAMVSLLRQYENFDIDPDTVDGMPTYEMFVDTLDVVDKEGSGGLKVDDSDRQVLQEKLRAITRPYLDKVLTPFVQQRYPSACTKGNGRNCTPCYSLMRRYRHGERQSHATHHDGHAIVTVVVSLSDYGTDYRGGLYVATGHGQQEFLALRKGDAVVHQSTLLHGVKVYDLEDNPKDTERWSWILWYRDSQTCEDYSYEWFSDCADAGDAVCQHLHATKVGNIPGISPEQAMKRLLELNRLAAEGGHGASANKMARAYLHLLPSTLPFDAEEGRRFYRLAIESNNPEGHYGMAQMILSSLSRAETEGRLSDPKRSRWKEAQLHQTVRHLEAAAFAGHAFSMFNLGIVHTYGYGTPAGRKDFKLAGEWYERSGLPEGFYVAAWQADAAGDVERKQTNLERAKVLGHFADWRKDARKHTGSGGVGGVDLNLPWPVAADGRRPPQL